MISIVFENSDFIFCDKESGVLTTPGRPHEKDQRPCLGLELQENLQIQIYPVHRLDFEVSGLVLFAKNAKAHAIANSWFEHKKILKTYRALSHFQDISHLLAHQPAPAPLHQPAEGDEFRWNRILDKGKKRAFESPRGKPSLTLARITEIRDDSNLLVWDLTPVTGRSHQLRYEMSRQGFPILGDKLYGSKVHFGSQAIALRAFKLSFENCPEAGSLGLPLEVKVAAL